MTAYRPWRLTPLCLALGAALATPVLHAAPRASAPLMAAAGLPAADDADAREADERYNRAVIDGRLDEAYRTLETRAATGPARQRADVLLLVARMRWREGRLSEAEAAVDRSIALTPQASAWRLKGDLLDAQGQPREALVWLEKARDASPGARQREALGLRIAVMKACGGDPAALERFAQRASEATRWRSSLVLGLLGQPDRALALAESAGPQAASFDAELRMVDWALRAGNSPRAKHHAWRAVERAGSTGERRYALAVWVEAWRTEQNLAGAADALAQRPATPEFMQTRVDLLLELGRPDEALALVERSTDPALRQRLLTVLQASGRTADVEREYRRLIQEQPAQVRWVEALAELRLAQGDEPGALRAYQALLDRNAQQTEVVIAAARSMISHGLSDAAVAMLHRMPSSPALAQATRGLLLERYLDQGQEDAALAILEAWRDELPATSPSRAEVAEGYERLGRQAQALATLQAWRAAGGHLDDDQLAHVAELLSATGDDTQAMALWRTLWAKARLPARKDFLERKIVSTAKRQGQLTAMADELQARQERGQASTDEINLLMSLRIASFDGPGVQAAVATYAKQGKLSEQARLEQLARVYARMRDVPALVSTLRSLARLDREGAPDYLNQALQTLLQQPDAREVNAKTGQLSGQVGEIVAELQATSGLDGAENSRYLAGIYASSGLQPQALALYQRALALAPRDGDGLLQLAESLKTSGKAAEASALLQRSALRAGDSAGFATAVSGLLDVFTGDPDGREDGGASLSLKSTRLSWALRQVLTRIAEEGDNVRLNSLVADVAQSQENAALQLRAYEASLPIAQDQRAAVLRQLIALSSDQKTAGAGVLARAADLPRKVTFGRRLIALRQDFAASVYVDLARAMLAVGDPAGAELAFSMVDDTAGLTNVAALRAAAYADVNRIDDALAAYRLALLRDPDDAATIVAASVLWERQGQPTLAWDAQWRGLLSLVGRQPSMRDGLSESAALDASQYVPTLVEGVLINWPSGERATAALAAWRQLFERALASVDATRPLSDQVRLQSLVRINRRLAEHVAPDAGLQALEDTLARKLPNDVAFANDRRAYAHQTGLAMDTGDSAAVATAGNDWPLRALTLQAADQGPAHLGLLLALEGHDDVALRQLAARALAAEAIGRREQQANVIQTPGALGAWIGTVRSAIGRMPARQLDELLVRPLEQAPYHDDVLFDLYRGDLPSFNALEKAVGRPLLSNETLLERLVRNAGDPLPEAAIRRTAAPDPAGAGAGLARFSIDEKLTLQERMVQAMEQRVGASGLLDVQLQDLLHQPLNEQQRARLLAVTARMTAVTSPYDELGGPPPAASANLKRLMVLDLPPERQPLLLEMATRFSTQVPEAARLPDFLRAWYANDGEAAYRAFLAIQDTLRAQSDASVLQMPQVAARFEEERRRDVEAFLALPHPTTAQAQEFYRHHMLRDAGGRDPTAREQARRYRAMLRAVPDSAVYLNGVLFMDIQRNDMAAFVQDLQPYLNSQPGDRDAATLMALSLRMLGQPERAAEVARAAALDLDDPDRLVAQWDLGRAARLGGASGAAVLSGLFPAVFDAYRNSPVIPPAVLAALPDRLKPGGSPDPIQESGPWQALLEVPADSPELRGRLRQRWRDSLGPGEAERGTRAQLMVALPRTYAVPAEFQEETRLRPLFLQRPAVSDELEAYLLAMAPSVRQTQTRLYTLLVQGLLAQGRADDRRARLLEALAQGRLESHGLQLLGTLVATSRQGLGARELSLLETRLRQQPVMAPGERLLFVRMFARSGDDTTAESLLRVAVLQLLYPSEQDSAPGMAPMPTLAEAAGVLVLWSDARRAAELHRSLADLVTESRTRDGTGGRHPEPFPPAPPTSP